MQACVLNHSSRTLSPARTRGSYVSVLPVRACSLPAARCYRRDKQPNRARPCHVDAHATFATAALLTRPHQHERQTLTVVDQRGAQRSALATVGTNRRHRTMFMKQRRQTTAAAEKPAATAAIIRVQRRALRSRTAI